MQAKFASETRYVTRRIADEMTAELQLFLWLAIDERIASSVKTDYLQVFKFEKISDGLYAIRHTQEQPDLTTVYYQTNALGIESMLGKTVFVIDDGDHSTMLFAEEY